MEVIWGVGGMAEDILMQGEGIKVEEEGEVDLPDLGKGEEVIKEEYGAVDEGEEVELEGLTSLEAVDEEVFWTGLRRELQSMGEEYSLGVIFSKGPQTP